jgi:hypothetical protein
MKLLRAAAIASTGIASVLAVYACATRREAAPTPLPLASAPALPPEEPSHETSAPSAFSYAITPPDKAPCAVRGEHAPINHLLLATPTGPEVIDLRVVAASAALSTDRTVFVEAHDDGIQVHGYVEQQHDEMRRDHDTFLHPAHPIVIGGVFYVNGKASFAFDAYKDDRVIIRFPTYNEYAGVDVACDDLSLDVGTFAARMPLDASAPLRDAWASYAHVTPTPPDADAASDEAETYTANGVVHVLQENADSALVVQDKDDGEIVGWVARSALGPLPDGGQYGTPRVADLMMSTSNEWQPSLSVTCKGDIPLLVHADDDRLYVVGAIAGGTEFTAMRPADLSIVNVTTDGINFRWPSFVRAEDLGACELKRGAPPAPPSAVDAHVVSAPSSLTCASYAASKLAEAAQYCYGVYLDRFRIGRAKLALGERLVTPPSESYTLSLEVGPEGHVRRASATPPTDRTFRMNWCLELVATEIVLPCRAGGAADANLSIAVDIHPAQAPSFDPKAAEERGPRLP